MRHDSERDNSVVWVILFLIVLLGGGMYCLNSFLTETSEQEGTVAMLPYTETEDMSQEETPPPTMGEEALQTAGDAHETTKSKSTGEAQTMPVMPMGINAFYVGDTCSEGQTISLDDVIVVLYYSDGNIEELGEWTMTPALQPLAAGDNVYQIETEDLMCQVVISAERVDGSVQIDHSGKTEVKREEESVRSETQSGSTKSQKDEKEESLDETEESTVEVEGIAVYWMGGDRQEGDYVSQDDIAVDVYYTDGSVEQNVKGWYCKEVGHPLKKGENFLTIYYQSEVEKLSVTGK